MEAVMGVGAIVGVLFFIFCAVKESSTTGLYKFYGVYGRFKAYLFIDMILAGPAMIIMTFVPSDSAELSPFVSILVGLACLAIGILIYITTAAKCPPDLRKKLLISMIISGCGVAMKVVVFFLAFVWAIYGPQEMTTADGETVYKIGSDVYDAGGSHIGSMDGPDKFIRNR